MSRAIYVQDMDDLIRAPSLANATDASFPLSNAESGCRRTFQDVLITDGPLGSRHLTGERGVQARLQRTRGRLAQYRHDLLVGMRVVNRVEREVVQAEWEDWVNMENERCDMMRMMLKQHAESTTSAQQSKGVVQKLREELDSYCLSCKNEVEAMRVGA